MSTFGRRSQTMSILSSFLRLFLGLWFLIDGYSDMGLVRERGK